MKPSKALKTALKLLETEGWIQGYFSSEEGYCSVGALAEVTGALEAGVTQRDGEWIDSALIVDNNKDFNRAIGYLGAVIVGEGVECDLTELIDANDKPWVGFGSIRSTYEHAIGLAISNGE